MLELEREFTFDVPLPAVNTDGKIIWEREEDSKNYFGRLKKLQLKIGINSANRKKHLTYIEIVKDRKTDKTYPPIEILDCNLADINDDNKCGYLYVDLDNYGISMQTKYKIRVRSEGYDKNDNGRIKGKVTVATP